MYCLFNSSAIRAVAGPRSAAPNDLGVAARQARDLAQRLGVDLVLSRASAESIAIAYTSASLRRISSSVWMSEWSLAVSAPSR